MRLSELKPGDKAVILKVLGHGAFRKRIMEMGFIQGKTVTVELNAPLKDPVKYKVMDYEVSLRRSEASMIEVITEKEAKLQIKESDMCQSSVIDDCVKKVIRTSTRQINIALVGNPNSGKTSFFNAASGSHERVGNYSGVTVDAKRGDFSYNGYKFIIYDLPGTYALTAYSPEEQYVRRHLTDQTPDVVINVVAASNLERNLYLTTDLIDMDCPTVMALNMYDELQHSGGVIDYKQLGDMLGMPIIPTVSRTGKGIKDVFDAAIALYENRIPDLKHIHITHRPEIEESISVLEKCLKEDGSIQEHFSTRYLATRLLEGDADIKELLSKESKYAQWLEERNRQVENIEKLTGEDIETTLTNDKYGFISGALKETFTPGEHEQMKTTKIIDSFVTNKLFGFPIFLFLMWLMFEATFVLGAYPMEWIENGVSMLGDWLNGIMPDGMLKDLLIDGIIGGVGGVIVFLPNILILYLFISFMEDSGYMARAAFIMDKLMHRMGLHGKSFIPLVMGFGCNVPAMMASRSIESTSSRIITILITPFMSCSARLPVYILLIGTFFPKHASLIFIGLYVLGIIIAIITAKLLRKFKFKKDETPFVMELPPYRIPTARSTMIHMWEKAAQYLRKMGGVILVASIAIWFLSYFPRHEAPEKNHAATASIIAQNTDIPDGDEVNGAVLNENLTGGQTEAINSDVTITSVANTTDTDLTDETFTEYERQKNSYIGRIGQFITPVMKPLGFDWQISVALVTGAAAKELIVSTMGVLYSENSNSATMSLQERLRMPDPLTGEPAMTPLTAISLLVFILLYFPCIAAIVAISRETGSWKWGLFSFVYNTAVAWIVSFLIYNIGSLFI